VRRRQPCEKGVVIRQHIGGDSLQVASTGQPANGVTSDFLGRTGLDWPRSKTTTSALSLALFELLRTGLQADALKCNAQIQQYCRLAGRSNL